MSWAPSHARRASSRTAFLPSEPCWQTSPGVVPMRSSRHWDLCTSLPVCGQFVKLARSPSSGVTLRVEHIMPATPGVSHTGGRTAPRRHWDRARTRHLLSVVRGAGPCKTDCLSFDTFRARGLHLHLPARMSPPASRKEPMTILERFSRIRHSTSRWSFASLRFHLLPWCEVGRESKIFTASTGAPGDSCPLTRRSLLHLPLSCCRRLSTPLHLRRTSQERPVVRRCFVGDGGEPSPAPLRFSPTGRA